MLVKRQTSCWYYQDIGYVASFDEETNVIKYIQDRSLYFNKTTELKEIIDSESSFAAFESSSESVTTDGGFSASVDTTFTGITTIIGNNVVNLGVNFTDGIANSQINKRSGEIIYLDNRPTIARNSRQKEDIKVVLEFWNNGTKDKSKHNPIFWRFSWEW